MLKNENGCPCARDFERVIRTDVAPRSCDCGGTGDCLDEKPLAYVYAPNQKFCMLYSAEDALSHGTLFEDLYKPMEVYGRKH